MKAVEPTQKPGFYTVDDVAETCRVSSRTVRRWIDNDDLVAHRIGRLIRISPADLDTFLKIRRMA